MTSGSRLNKQSFSIISPMRRSPTNSGAFPASRRWEMLPKVDASSLTTRCTFPYNHSLTATRDLTFAAVVLQPWKSRGEPLHSQSCESHARGTNEKVLEIPAIVQPRDWRSDASGCSLFGSRRLHLPQQQIVILPYIWNNSIGLFWRPLTYP